MTSSACKKCCERINLVKVAHGSAAIAVYIQGLFWLAFSLYTTSGDSSCVNMTSPCSDYPEEFCGVECPTGLVFMVLTFGNILVSVPGIMQSVYNESRTKHDMSQESKMALVCYTIAGVVTTGLELHYLHPIFGLVTGLLYVYAITVTREFWWKKPAEKPAAEPGAMV